MTFVAFLVDKNVKFPAVEVASAGKNFVKTIVECLWYVDGHHEKLKKQSAPDYFGRFTGYNLPELSKHRKRQHANLSASILKSLSLSLFQNLQASFWSLPTFRQLQQHTRLLAHSLADYSDYLSSQNKVICCICRHYSFQIKKCDSETCDTCKPVRLPKEVFDSLQVLPDPVLGEDGHHKTLDDVLGTETDESHRPSLQKTPKRRKTLPFSASIQHVRNVDLMLQCDECAMWRLLYSKFKLTKKERTDLQVAIEDISFTCGAPLQDLQLPECLSEVYTRELSCGEPIEKLYYTEKYSPICIYCADTVDFPVSKDKYPQCHACQDKPEIAKL